MRRSQVAFGLLAIVQMSLIAAISLVSVALPAMQQELGLGEIQLTLISAGYGLAFSGLLILGGRLGDAVGPTFTFVTGMTIFGVASGTAGFAPGFGPLLVARFAQGVGAALAAPAALTLAGALFTDPDQRTRALAAWGGLSATGAVAGMLLSGAIVAWLGWRWVFAPPTTVAALALIAAPRVVPGAYFAPVSRLPPAPRLAPDRGVTPGEGGAEPPRLDIIGSVLITTGLSALTYGLLALASGGSLGTAWAVTGLGVALVVLFVRVESRARHPLVPMSFFKERRRRLALVTIVAASAASAATSFFLSLFLQQVRGLSALQTSAYFTPMLLIVGAGAVAGRWIRRLGALWVAALGAAGTSLSLVMLAVWVAGRAGALGLPGFLLFPLGLGLTFSGATVAALAGVGGEEQGLAGGVVNTAMEVGPTVGLAALVSLSRLRASVLVQGGHAGSDATAAGYAAALYVAAFLFALLFVGFLVVLRRLETRPVTSS